MDEIPQWAWDRVIALSGQHIDPRHYVGPFEEAFARYIAEHEPPPVDPLLEEAREIAAAQCDRLAWNVARDAIAQGLRDEGPEMSLALAALRRGIEIGKGGCQDV